MAARLLGQRMTAFWPEGTQGRTLGLGYALPFLPLWEREDAPCFSARLDTHVTRAAPVAGARLHGKRPATAVR
ncbi:hypothetical protein RAA17_20165 [Komagataeibacter rhaeticus]|nr:hypothetical protein [Komagataeibacter rhaeticus]